MTIIKLPGVVRFAFIAFAVVAGGCMNPIHLSNIRQSLLTPGSFQSNYGDVPQAISDAELPADAWRGLTLRGWTFQKVHFSETQFLADTFENVTFDRCLFDRVTVKNCVFINCVFKEIMILSGEWTDSRYQGGGFKNAQWRHSSESDDGITWERMQFEAVTLEQCTTSDRSGHWRQCAFRQSRFLDDDFGAITMDEPSFVQCGFRGVRFPNAPKSQFQGCQFVSNQALVPGVGGKFQHVKFNEPDGIKVLGAVEDGEFLASQRLVAMDQATRVVIRAPQFGVRVGIAEDVRLEGASGDEVGFFGGGKRIVIENVKGKALVLHSGTYEDCVFRNIEVEQLDLTRAHLVRCEFQNVMVKRSVLMAGEVATFTDCKFDRFRRLPQVPADSYSNEPPHAGFLFPFELAPGVNKP